MFVSLKRGCNDFCIAKIIVSLFSDTFSSLRQKLETRVLNYPYVLFTTRAAYRRRHVHTAGGRGEPHTPPPYPGAPSLPPPHPRHLSTADGAPNGRHFDRATRPHAVASGTRQISSLSSRRPAPLWSTGGNCTAQLI